MGRRVNDSNRSDPGEVSDNGERGTGEVGLRVRLRKTKSSDARTGREDTWGR